MDDDRRHCAACLNLAGRHCRTRGCAVMDDLPRRCLDYRPGPVDDDRRTGRERWPWMDSERRGSDLPTEGNLTHWSLNRDQQNRRIAYPGR